MSKQYSYDEAQVNITTIDKENIAIFDVSRTTECRWIAISDKSWALLEIFKNTNEMLEYVARKDNQDAEITTIDHWLDDQAMQCGYDSWQDMCKQIGEHDLRKERPEFPTYLDAQGREHAEF